MKIIITGGRGFIGHNLALLLSKEHDVHVVDNEIAPPVAEKIKNVNYRKLCVSKLSLLGIKADVIYHLGEYSRVEKSYDNPLKSMTNIISTIPYVLDYCAKNNAKLIYSGSSTKFGNSKSPYSVSKALNCELINWYCKTFSVDYAICYFYNAYGDNERHSGEFSTVVSKFIKSKTLGEPVIVTGDGSQRRNFTHVSDICRGLKIVLENGYGDGHCIGSDKSYSINDLVNLVGVEHTYTDKGKGNRDHATINTDKMNLLGWKPQCDLEQYIKEKL